MSRIQERIPREQFQEIFKPMIRTLGAKNIILKINEIGKTAIPRQTNLDQLMSKLEILCYEQNRAKVEEAIEQLWEFYVDDRLGERAERFQDLSDALNETLDGEKVPEDPEKRQKTNEAISNIVALFKESDLSDREVEAVFRVKAYPDVLKFFLETRLLKT
jgi:hypothetical protein